MYKVIDKGNGNLICNTYPANDHTTFMVGDRGFYTIIDVVTIRNKMCALLEHNVFGEEDCIVVLLGRGEETNVWILEKYNHKSIDVHLSQYAQKVIYIPSDRIIIDNVYDDIVSMFEEEGYDRNEIILWSSEEINNEAVFSGGIIK